MEVLEKIKDWQTEWKMNAFVYRHGSRKVRKAMESRAIYFAALTIHTAWGITIRYWKDGRFPTLPCAKVFLTNRQNKSPEDWQGNKPIPKVQFARALLGFKYAGCIDLHMQASYPHIPTTAVVDTLWQWQVWLENLYPRNRAQVQVQHAEVLYWVRTGKGRI